MCERCKLDTKDGQYFLDPSGSDSPMSSFPIVALCKLFGSESFIVKDFAPIQISLRHLLLFALLLNVCEGISLSSITPCAYPLLHDTKNCGIDDLFLRGSVRVCDPDKVISMSEVAAIKDKLEQIQSTRLTRCLCRHDQARPCWYRFGFAFLRQMIPIESGVADVYNREFCPVNETLLRYARTNRGAITARNFIENYGNNFARLIRERWLMGECDEDILFLIVMKKPPQLITRPFPRKSSKITYLPTTPFIFSSYGSLVIDKMEALDPSEGEFPLKYRPDPLRRIIETENANLQNGYPLKAVIERLLERFAETLTKAEEASSYPRVRSHIPNWAIGVFAACAFLCVLMAIGLCLMRTSVRRSSQRSKMSMDVSRRWKAGFVGGMWQKHNRCRASNTTNPNSSSSHFSISFCLSSRFRHASSLRHCRLREPLDKSPLSSRNKASVDRGTTKDPRVVFV